MADVEFDDFEGAGSAVPSARMQHLVSMAGAATSIALVIGLGVWGYRLAVRDVTGIPVVRALEGPMRIAPENPGGEIAAHQGLAVNDIAADGVASAPAETLVLAPRPVDLALDDAPGLAAPVVVAADAPVIDGRQALATDAVPLSAQGASEAVPLALLPEEDGSVAAPEELAPDAEADPGAGLARSPRPMPRPAGRDVATEATPVAAVATPEIDPATLTPGTKLVQLGAFDDDASARTEWARLLAQFGDLMGGKALVIETAQSGGRTFFRLRAHGFATEDDSRRFCTALLTEGASCVPVTLR